MKGGEEGKECKERAERDNGNWWGSSMGLDLEPASNSLNFHMCQHSHTSLQIKVNKEVIFLSVWPKIISVDA